MHADTRSKILAALTAEREALQSFVALLEQEHGALIENHTDRLLELAELKSSSALILTGLAEARHLLFQQHIAKLEPATIKAWLLAQDQAAYPIWQEVIALSERARHLNQTSGELIQLKLRHNQQALLVLDNATSKSNVYGPDGQPNLTPGSGRSIGSA